jgi:hypothetical protein
MVDIEDLEGERKPLPCGCIEVHRKDGAIAVLPCFGHALYQAGEGLRTAANFLNLAANLHLNASKVKSRGPNNNNNNNNNNRLNGYHE